MQEGFHQAHLARGVANHQHNQEHNHNQGRRRLPPRQLRQLLFKHMDRNLYSRQKIILIFGI